MILGCTSFAALPATDINTWVKEIQSKPLEKDIRALVDDITTNNSCCHSASTTTKTFTSASLTASSNDARDAENSIKTRKTTPQSVPVLIFMSYSVPRNVWVSLLKEAEMLGLTIQFVIRGLPENSFQKLAEKVTAYNCPVMIDPTLFTDYNITAVPAFVFREKDHVRGTYGNISIAYAKSQPSTQATHNEVATNRSDSTNATSQAGKTGALS